MEADTETPEQGVAVTPQPGALPPSWKWASSGEHLRAVPLAIQSSIIWGEYVLQFPNACGFVDYLDGRSLFYLHGQN